MFSGAKMPQRRAGGRWIAARHFEEAGDDGGEMTRRPDNSTLTWLYADGMAGKGVTEMDTPTFVVCKTGRGARRGQGL